MRPIIGLNSDSRGSIIGPAGGERWVGPRQIRTSLVSGGDSKRSRQASRLQLMPAGVVRLSERVTVDAVPCSFALCVLNIKGERKNMNWF